QQEETSSGVPTEREPDVRAMTSCNDYLSESNGERSAGLQFWMRRAIAAMEAGAGVQLVLDKTRAALIAGGFSSVDYVELADAETLEPLERLGMAPARLFVAARIGGTRLIDNMPVAAPPA